MKSLFGLCVGPKFADSRKRWPGSPALLQGYRESCVKLLANWRLGILSSLKDKAQSVGEGWRGDGGWRWGEVGRDLCLPFRTSTDQGSQATLSPTLSPS